MAAVPDDVTVPVVGLIANIPPPSGSIDGIANSRQSVIIGSPTRPKKRFKNSKRPKNSHKNGKLKYSKLDTSTGTNSENPSLQTSSIMKTPCSGSRPVASPSKPEPTRTLRKNQVPGRASVRFSVPACTTFSEPALHLAADGPGSKSGSDSKASGSDSGSGGSSPVDTRDVGLKCDVATQTPCRSKRRRKKRCCRWMLAATLRSCFGPCFKRLGAPAGYDSIEDSPSPHDQDNLSSQGYTGRQRDNGYDTVGRSFDNHGLDYCNRSKSTSEIFRSDDFYYAPEFIRPDKRSFSASFGYLDDNELFETLSQGMRSTLTSTNDLRSDMSEAFWSCRGSVSRSSTGLNSDQDFYSDQSEEPHLQDAEDLADERVCEHCGSSGKEHSYSETDRCNWRETSLTSSLPIPKSQKWIQLD